MTLRRCDSIASRRFRLLAASVALAVIMAPLAARAGFEIRGAGIPSVPPQSGGAVQSDSTLAPIGMMPDAAGQATIPVTAVPIDAPAPVDQAVSQVAQSSGVLSGFGDDLPLVIALQQVAPPGYQFAFAPGIDLGQRVSWQGGKPWRDVTRDMLDTAGLAFETRDDNVLMVTQQGAVAPVMQTAQVSPPAPPSPPAPVETTNVRREKPSSLMARIRSQLSRDEVPVEATVAPAPLPAPVVAEEMTQVLDREEQFAPAPGEDLSPIALTVPRSQPRATPVMVRPPQMSAVPAESWQATAGMTLRDALQDWAARAGVELYWSIDYDYRLRDDVRLQGSFTDAATELLDRFAAAKPRPYAQLHQQGGQPRVLVVRAYGVGY